MVSLANTFVDGNGLDLLSSNLGRFNEGVKVDAREVEDALTLHLISIIKIIILPSLN